jgi:hypothetical protein
MLYVTIIIVTILVVVCIITCNYFNKIYNPALYNFEDDMNAIHIISEGLLNRYEEYKNASEKDSYVFHISEKEFINCIENINNISKL